MNWLLKNPTSAEQVLKVINAANEAYQRHKITQKKLKSRYEENLQKKGIYVGSLIKVTDQFDGRVVEVLSIKGNAVKVLDKDGDKKIWRMRNFNIEKVDEK